MSTRNSSGGAPDGSKLFFLPKNVLEKRESLNLVSVLGMPCCDVTLAWSSIVLTTVVLPKEMTWRCPAEIFAACDHGPLFPRVVGDVVTAPIGFSMPFARRGVVPRVLGEGVERWPFSLVCW